jgi:hypothetical protein
MYWSHWPKKPYHSGSILGIYWSLLITFTMKSGAENRMAKLRILAFWPDWKTGIHQAQKGAIPEDKYTSRPEVGHC